MIFPLLRRGPRVVALSLIGALVSAAAAAVPAVPAATLEESASPSPDARAELATRRLTDVKHQIRTALGGACPSSADGWEAWLEQVLALAATLIAVGDLDGPLKKSGTSLEQLRAFDDAKGSAMIQLSTADAAIRKIHECAATLGLTPPPTHELVDRVYDRADVLKQREEAALGLAELYRPVKRPSERERRFF